MNEKENKNTTTNAITLTDDKELRQKYIDRVDVLDKVKNLLMIPSMELMTMRQVAEYYEVDVQTVKKQFQRNKDEFVSDGSTMKTSLFFKEFFNGTKCPVKNIETMKGKVVVKIDENTTLIIPSRGIRVFPKRAVLRMGMLLRDSVIAQEVRTQLLNIVENVTSENPEKAIEEIENEQKYLNDIMDAFQSGDVAQVLAATAAYNAYQKRNIVTLKKDNAELTQKNEMLAEDNSILAGNILAWSNRASANKVVRLMAQKLGWRFGSCWNEIYNELLYRHNINLKSRHTKGGKKSAPLLEYLHEDEWKDLYQTIAAMLQARYVNPSEIFEKAKLST